MSVTTALAACASGRDERARLAAEVADLRGQIEDVKRAGDAAARERARLQEQLKSLDAQQAFVLADVKTSRAEQDRVAKALEQHAAALAELRAAVEDVQRKSEAPPPPANPGRGANVVPPRDADTLYADAMATFRAEEHGQAIVEFNELVDRFPQHPLASNAQYWIGEAYYRQRDFRQALTEFRTVIEKYPQSTPVAEAFLKIGLCQRALRDPAAARESWERVTRDYAGTNAATQARALIGQLGGQGRPAR